VIEHHHPHNPRAHHHHNHHGPVDGGPAVLDIGGDVGALVATMPDGALGTELFLRPVADPSSSVHTGVWRRDLGAGCVTVALFPELAVGTYDVLGGDGDETQRIEVCGGEVTTIDLR
jgi:hypothetical protein